MNEFDYFQMNEFACKHCGKNEMDRDFIHKLDEARNTAGVPFVITSGYRCEEHNEAVGGSPTSSHMKGHAVDISCTDSRTRWLIIGALFEAGINRIGIGENFIHCDDDPKKPSEVVWLY